MKIVIVGGGTAGWISALILKKETGHEISLIDSSDVGPLGVGESTTGLFQDIIKKYFVEEEFVQECGVTPKLGTEFIGWSEKNFYSPLNGTFSSHNEFDYALYYGYKNNTLNNYSKFSLLSDNNKINFSNKTTEKEFLSDRNNAYHLDTFKTIEYLKKKCIQFGVKFIDAKVLKTNLNWRKKVTSLETSVGNIDCDFVIDCSGFNRIVASIQKPKFISYEKWLSVNTALTFNLPWDIVKYPKPVTTSIALSCGWMWMIPTRHSIGCGIVFDKNFATDDEIISEVNEILHVSIEVKKKINFRSGRLQNALIQNVATVGTSYSFLEPLQATSIHTTILQIQFLIKYLNIKITRREYNKFCGEVVDSYADFVSLHYQFKYIDNKFWNSRKPRQYTNYIIKKSKKSFLHLKDYKINNEHKIGHFLWSYVLAGGELLTKKDFNFSDIQMKNIRHWEGQIIPTLNSSMTFDQFRSMY